jgi:hypothetical protein
MATRRTVINRPACIQHSSSRIRSGAGSDLAVLLSALVTVLVPVGVRWWAGLILGRFAPRLLPDQPSPVVASRRAGSARLPLVCGGEPTAGCRHPGAPRSRAGSPGRRRHRISGCRIPMEGVGPVGGRLAPPASPPGVSGRGRGRSSAYRPSAQGLGSRLAWTVVGRGRYRVATAARTTPAVA